MTNLRLDNISICLNAGFRPTTSLPTELGRELRPALEIAQRLNAIQAMIFWVMVSEDQIGDERILNFIDQNNLKDVMDEFEQEIFNISRNDESTGSEVGWKYENMWPLAWYFGYEELDITGEMITHQQIREILTDFCCPLDERVEDWVKDRTTRSEEELMKKEDLFYCLHNAVRSAQLGRVTVPEGFDPRINGGVIHERRHTLTWMVSKGVSWEDTDLGT